MRCAGCSGQVNAKGGNERFENSVELATELIMSSFQHLLKATMLLTLDTQLVEEYPTHVVKPRGDMGVIFVQEFACGRMAVDFTGFGHGVFAEAQFGARDLETLFGHIEAMGEADLRDVVPKVRDLCVGRTGSRISVGVDDKFEEVCATVK